MSYKFMQILILICLCPFIIQCATQKEVRTLELRIRNLDNRLLGTDQGVKVLEEKTADRFSLERSQKLLAQQGATLDRLESDLLQVKAQLEESSRAYRLIQEENENIKAQLSGNLGNLTGKLDNITMQLDKTSAGLEDIKQERLREETERVIREAKAAERAAAKAKVFAEKKAGMPRQIEPDQAKKKIEPGEEKTTGTTTPSTITAPSATEFDRGLALFRAGKFKEAIGNFEKYLTQSPKGGQAAMARFYLGESLFKRKEFELAILEYQRVIDDFRKHGQAPAALFQQGLAFEALKDVGTAKMVYYKLLDEYPKSDQAVRAKQRLDTLE